MTEKFIILKASDGVSATEVDMIKDQLHTISKETKISFIILTGLELVSKDELKEMLKGLLE